MKLPRDKEAIVLIESQNDFLSPGGSMYQMKADWGVGTWVEGTPR